MGPDDVAQVIVFLVLFVLWLFRGRKTDTRPNRPRPETHEHQQQRGPVARHAPQPEPRRRPHVGELPAQAPLSARLEGMRPEHLVSSRTGGQDSPLSDFVSTRTGDRRADTAAVTGSAERVDIATAEGQIISERVLRSAVVWKEILGPPRSLLRSRAHR